MSPVTKEITTMLDMLPESEQELAYEFIKRLVLAWDSDFTKVTETEREQIKRLCIRRGHRLGQSPKVRLLKKNITAHLRVRFFRSNGTSCRIVFAKHKPERNIRKFGNSITLAAFQGKPFHAGFDCLVCGSLTYEVDFRKLTFTLESVAAELGALFQTENSFHSAVGGILANFIPDSAVKPAHINALQNRRVEI